MYIPTKIKEKMDKLTFNGYEAYIVGGAVRDSILGEEPKDWDIFTNASGEKIKEIFPNGKIIGGEERQKKILTVIVDGVEISTYRKSGDRTEVGGTIDDHINTCDFTINAIAVNSEGEIYNADLLDDLSPIIIKAVGNPKQRLLEDALRAFRGVRFWAKYSEKYEKNDDDIGSKYSIVGIDESTLLAIQFVDINGIAPERIKDELMKIFKYKDGLSLLKNTHLLEKIWPEFIPQFGMDGGHHHNEDVWTHTDEAYKISCKLTDNVMHHIACALHDIGKPTCYRVENGKINFKAHDHVGQRIANNMLSRLKFPNHDIDYVCTLIRHHLFGISGEPKIDKGYKRLYQDLERISKKENTSYPNIVEDLTLLFYCDYQANLANPREKFADYLVNSHHTGPRITYNYYLLKQEKKPFSLSDLKVKGSDILSLGVLPGPRVGQLLQAVWDLTSEGILKNERHEQMFWLREQIGLEQNIRRNRSG